MPKFRLEYQGKQYDVDAPDEDTALNAFADSMGIAPQQPQQQFSPLEPGLEGLPIPGTFDPARDTPSPNLNFGLTQSDTLNPLPMINAFGNNLASSIPIAGPYLKKAGEKVDAWLDNTIYRPLMGQPGTTKPEDVAAYNADIARQNPIAADAGKVVGATAPYAVAAGLPVVSGAMGFTGPMLQRLLMTGASQYAINTGDNMANGQDLPTAAGNAVMPSLLAMPSALIGPGKKLEGPRADAVKVLQREGVPLSGGQSRGSKRLMTAESALGGASAQDFQEKQLAKLTKAALRYAGVNADNAGPDVMRQAFSTAGGKFDSLAAVTRVDRGQIPQFANDLMNARQTYIATVGTPAPAVDQIIRQVTGIVKENGGIVPGTSYKALTTQIREMTKNASSPELKGALSEIKEALDDAIERSVGGKTLEAWRKVRAEYKNLMTVMDAVTRSGSADGFIRPKSLWGAVVANDGKRNYAKGVGDLNELARAADIAMPAIPDSGSAGRIAAMLATGSAGASMANIFGQGGLQQAAIGAASLAAPYLAGKAMLSAPGRAIMAGKGTSIPSIVARGAGSFLVP